MITKFDRTGTEPDHVYDLVSEAKVYDVGGGCKIVEVGATCPSDPRTKVVCCMRLEDGRPFLWGEDSDGDRCWIREDDAVARSFMDEFESLNPEVLKWGQGRDPEDADSNPSLLTGWGGIEVLGALSWDDEPAVWACVRVPEGTRVIDFGGASTSNRYHAPCVELEEVPDEEG